ncbi:MAG TPA: HNH endonuclease family protein, partial [Ignavibacteriaceae bacterium]
EEMDDDDEEGNEDLEKEEVVIRQLDEKIETLSIVEFLKEIKQASLLYRKIRMREFDEEKINYHLLNLQRILSLPSYIFLLNLFKRNLSLNTKIEALKLIETFMLRRHICLKRTGELDPIFSQIVITDEKNIIHDLKKHLSENLPEDEEFEDYFPKHIFKGKLVDRARYVLEQIEYHIIDDKGEYKLSSATDVHLEHIVPQTITSKKAKKEYGDWVEYLGENAVTRHKRYVSRIGNLTLIAGELNIKASNNPFNNKKDNYKKSKLKLNDSLANHYRQFKFQQIDERSKELTEIAMKIWRF